MKRLGSLLLLLVILATACTPSVSTQTATSVAVTATLPAPQINTTSTPDARETADSYLSAWQAEDYAAMFASLSTLSKDAFNEEEFIQRYQNISAEMSLINLEYQITSVLTNPKEAQVGYQVNFHTSLLNTITRDMVMNLTMENGDWHIQWEDAMILPELKGGNRLALDIQVPARGNIYDIEGNALVAESEVVALGITPGRIEDGEEGTLLSYLSRLTGLNPDYIQSLYEYAGPDWYIPVGETARSNVDRYYDTLASLGGLDMNYYNTRYYYLGENAAQVTGYVSFIGEDEVEEYKRLGYRVDEKIGRTGLEKWGEDYLIGQRGASLYVVAPDGTPVTKISSSDVLPSQSIYTTIERDFQEEVSLAINGFKGAAVVLERDTGRVLAMASSPSYDPNLFDPNNFNSSWMIGDIFDPAENRLLNRASQSAYPLGSVFKIITMAAALETETFTPQSTYMCGQTFTELSGVTLYDWTYEKDKPASGLLTLPEGLMRSCNPWFYHIGLVMFDRGLPDAVANMARGFGLGSVTGIGQVPEVAGNIPDPQTQGDAVQFAIGQGTTLVTPLQVAAFIAAVGNGGTLYRPQLVEQIVPPEGEPTFTFEPEINGELPVSQENLKVIQDAMRSVVNDPRGTARNTMLGLQIPVYGKTGTAQNEPLDPHAWFAGYTDLGNPDFPDISVVVLAENAGEGSEIAAPIFRRIVELYFFGKPLRIYPWESTFYVTATPTEQYTRTPTEAPTETPEP